MSCMLRKAGVLALMSLAASMVMGCGDNGQAELDAAHEARASAQSDLDEARQALEGAKAALKDAESEVNGLEADLDGYNERVERGGATYRERTAAAGVEPNLEPQSLDVSSDAERACEHFRNIVGDIVDGKLNAKEIGTKFGEVARDAKNADEKELHAASARAEDIAKTFDPETMFPAVVEVHDACSLVGR